MPLQGIDDVHGGDSFPLGMLSVSDGIANYVLEENLEYSSGFFVDQARDTLYSTTTSQTSDGGFGDTLDVITKHLTMPLSATLSKTLASLATTRHDDAVVLVRYETKTDDFPPYIPVANP